MPFHLRLILAAATALMLAVSGGYLVNRWMKRRLADGLPVWPYALALGLAVAQFVLMVRLVDGDFFNSYPYLSQDGFDYLVEGQYIRTFLTRGSVDLGETINAQALFPRTPAMLHVLRNPGFVVVTAADALLGSSGATSFCCSLRERRW